MKIFRHIFVVLLLLFISTTATAQSQSDNTRTKAVSATKADVNGDGVVNEADIEEILAIMQQENGTKYYWYVGTSNPAEMTSISPIVTDNTSSGWRLIGTSLPAYSQSKKLWDGVTNTISFGGRSEYYYAVPSNNIKLYDDTGASVMDTFTISETTINGVKYYIYKKNGKGSAVSWMVY